MTERRQAAEAPLAGERKLWPLATCRPAASRVLAALALWAACAACSTTAGAANTTYCWGAVGPWLGRSHERVTRVQATPARVEGPSFQALSTGNGHCCGLTGSGGAYCWGWSYQNVLGDGGPSQRTAPLAAPAPVAGNHSFAAISAGGDLTGALDTAGAAWCWGRANAGQLGTGGHEPSNVPVPVAGNLTFKAISAGQAHACAVGVDGAAFCWVGALWVWLSGTAAAGGMHARLAWPDAAELSNNWLPPSWQGGIFCDGPGPSVAPARVPSARALIFVSAARHCVAYAVDSERRALWWGTAGPSGYSAEPVELAGGHRFASVSVGTLHACGVDTQGRAWCW